MNSITTSYYVESDYFTMVSQQEVYEGVWFLPNKPEKLISGKLNVTPERIWLSLNGVFDENQSLKSENISYEIILGIQSNGCKFTLEKCTQDEQNTPLNHGYSTQIFVVTQVFVGIHVNNNLELKFPEYKINYTYLKDWLRNVGLEKPQKVDNGFFITYNPDIYTTVPKLEAHFQEFSIEIVSELTPYCKDNFQNSGIHIGETVKIQCHSAMSVKEVRVKILNSFQNFLNLATGMPNFVTSLSAVNSSSEIKIYAQSPYPSISLPSIFDERIVLFNAKNIENNLKPYLEKWINLENEIQDICKLFFGVHYDQGTFLTNRFLNNVQALEAYSRFRYGKYKESEDIHKKRVETIVDNAAEEHKSWLKNVLGYQNFKSLRSRLIELIEKANPIITNLISNPNKFVMYVVDTRNYLTHVDRSGKEHIISGDHLDSMTRSLIWLLRIHFLMEIGFDIDQCTSILQDNNSYQSLCKYIVDSNAPWISS